MIFWPVPFDSLRLKQDDWHFHFFKFIFLIENCYISTQISMMIVFNGQVNDMPSLVQIMAWHWTGTKPLSESMILFMHHLASLNWTNKIHPISHPPRWAMGCLLCIFLENINLVITSLRWDRCVCHNVMSHGCRSLTKTSGDGWYSLQMNKNWAHQYRSWWGF